MLLSRPAPRALGAAVLLALLAACASAGDPSPPRAESLLSRQPPPTGRRCHVATEPEALPPVDVVVDSAALSAAVRELGRQRAIDGGYALLSLGFDQNGWNARRAVIEHDLPAAVADSLQALVFAHRREVPPGRPWGVRLRIGVGGEPRFEMGRQEVCAPRLLDRALLADLAAVDLRDPFAATAGTNTVWLRVLVGEHGEIVEARIEQNPVGMRWEEPILTRARALSFEPALVDGIATASWTRVPIRLHVR